MLPNDVRARGSGGGDARALRLDGAGGDDESGTSGVGAEAEAKAGRSAWRDAWRAALPMPCMFVRIVRRRSESTDE